LYKEMVQFIWMHVKLDCPNVYCQTDCRLILSQTVDYTK
jgi:hypothetical protein